MTMEDKSELSSPLKTLKRTEKRLAHEMYSIFLFNSKHCDWTYSVLNLIWEKLHSC